MNTQHCYRLLFHRARVISACFPSHSRQISPSIQTVASLLALRYNSSTRQLTNRRSLLTSCRRWIRLQNANIVPLSRNLQTHPAIPGEKGRKRGVPVTWKSLGITSVLAGALWGTMMYLKHEKEQVMAAERQKQIGKAKIGGEWELTDHDGKPRTSADFHGRWVLLYFGFTHCPDICPDEIEKMIKTTELLEKTRPEEKFQPLFITVDPDRDSVAAVSRYVKEFSPKLVGLTGTTEQVSKAAKAFRVYFSSGTPDTDNDYIVDHTIIIYLIDPEGKFVDYYGQTKTAEQMQQQIEGHMNRYSYLRW